MSSPGIVMTGKFARPGSAAFSEYMDYMDRDEAVRNMAYNKYSAFVNQEGTEGTYENDEAETLEDYVKYMANPAKTSRLFSSDSSRLTHEDTVALKAQFKEASENGSVMWQDVFSFDNNWLIEHGYLDPKTNWLDEKKVHDATRAAMNKMLDKEGLLTSAIWTASIHYNTDNIHVHVATVEPKPLRKMKKIVDEETGEITSERQGYRSRKTLKAMKSAFANQLLGLEKERARIDELSKQIINGIRSDEGSMTIRKYEADLLDVIRKLPPQKGYRKYGYAKQFKFKEPLDRIIERFISESFPDIYEEMIQRQEYVSVEVSKAYGDKRGTGIDKENKRTTLYTRLGNAVLNQIKEMDIGTEVNQKKANVSRSDIQELIDEFDEVSFIDEKIEQEVFSFDEELNFLNEIDQEQSMAVEIKREDEAFQRALEKVHANPHKKVEGQKPTKDEWEKLLMNSH
ncbi:MobP2 family relaxase [Enterococcus termitis]